MRLIHEKKCMQITKIILFSALLPLLLSSCFRQVQSTINHNQLSLSSEVLHEHGLAFITPSTVTGQEEEKQAVAFIFANTLKDERPDLSIITLPETLSMINSAGQADEYRLMFKEYRDTGLFRKSTLAKIAQTTQTRYLGQLKLAGFRQGGSGRLSVFGLRLMETKKASLRLFFQIWDAQTGQISWEAVQELNWSKDTFSEDAVTLHTVIEEAAKNIAERLPK